jgi:hypothetical protein
MIRTAVGMIARQPAERRKTMPVAASQADVFEEWREILDGYEYHAERLTVVEPMRAALAESLAQALALKTQQAQYTALKEKATRELNEAVKLGRERARRARSAAKAALGTDSEYLVQFKVAPRRKHGPRKPKNATPAPAVDAPESAGSSGT